MENVNVKIQDTRKNTRLHGSKIKKTKTKRDIYYNGFM